MPLPRTRLLVRLHARLSAIAVTFLVSCLAVSNAALGEESNTTDRLDGIKRPCVMPSASEQVKPKPHKVVLDPWRLFGVDLAPYRFAVPWRYLHGRPPEDLATCKYSTNAVGIQFWIPDGAAPERDLSRSADFNPSERDRPRPSVGEWIIKFVFLQHYDEIPPVEADPENQFASFVKAQGSRIELDRRHGLTNARIKDSPNPIPHWLSKEDNAYVLIWCVLDRVCQGSLILEDKHLAGRFFLTRESVDFRDAIVPTLRMLLERWQIQK